MVVVTVAAYLVFLGWHQLQEYQRGEVWMLVAVLAALATWFGWRRQVWAGAMVQTLTVTVMWSVDATTDSPIGVDSLWLAGAMVVFIGALAGSLAVATTAAIVRRQTEQCNRDAPDA